MGTTRINGPTEYAFAIWVKNSPFSSHPLDQERFHQFAKTVCRYNSRKWLDFNFYQQKFNTYGIRTATNEKIEASHQRLLDYMKFHKTSPMRSSVSNDTDSDRIIKVIKNEIKVK